MTEPTTQQSTSGTASPSEQPMEEGQLIFGAVRALFFSAFIMILIGAIWGEVYSGIGISVSDALILGLASTVCSFLGLSLPLLAIWGCALVTGYRLNWILGKPLNPSAIAALAANLAFVVLTMFVSLASVAASNSSTPPPLFKPLFNSASGIAFLYCGSLLFQFTARIAVTKRIAHHNALAGRKLYSEPPCHIQFRIRQLMILTLVIAIAMVFVKELSARALLPNLMLSIVISMVTLGAAFYPAILMSASFSKKFGKVQLKPWERGRPLKLHPDASVGAAEPEQTQDDSLTNSEVKSDDSEALVIPISQYPKKAVSYDEHLAVVKWTSCSGGIFAMGLLVIVQFSKACHHQTNFYFSELAGAFLVGIPAFFFVWILSRLVHGVLWTLLEQRCKPGTIAALTGGAIGGTGTLLLLSVFELVHVNYQGSFSLHSNNLFPLASVLYGSLVGQAMSRMGIKIHGFRAGFSQEKYQALATDSLQARSTWLKPLLLSASCWCIFVASNRGTDPSVEKFLLELLTGTTGCMSAVWPLANSFVRSVRVAPKKRQIAESLPQLSPRSTPLGNDKPMQV